MTLASVARRERARHAWEFPGATHFSDDRNMRNGTWLIEQLRSLSGPENLELWDDLERETTDPETYEKRTSGRKHTVGRDRIDGHWSLIGCAWLLGKRPEIQFFCDDKADSRIWEAAGFKNGEAPSYWTTRDRLLELWHYRDGFLHASAKLWRNAMRIDERIGRHIAVDACFYETHARLQHRCLDPEACAANGGKRMPRWMERQTVSEAERVRHEEQREPYPEEERPGATVLLDPWDEDDVEEQTLDILDDGAPGEGEARADDEALDDADPIEESEPVHPKYVRRGRERRQVEPRELFIGWKKDSAYKHRYVCRDGEAGFRLYETRDGGKKKTVNGGLFLQATDLATGAVVCSLHIPADEQEAKHFDVLLERVRQILGRYPEAIVADRAYTVRELRELCGRLRIALITPFRKTRTKQKRRDARIPGVVDEYGVPECRHCGSPGTIVGRKPGRRGARLGFAIERGEPGVWFRCANAHTKACRAGRQWRAFKDAPMQLGVISHEEELYWELRELGKPIERANRLARARYAIAGDNVDTRAKALGIDYVELRATIAAFVEILRVSLRQGWIGAYEKRNERPPRRRDGRRGLKVFQRLRRLAGLVLPQGPIAQKLGLALPDGIAFPDGWVPVAERRKKGRQHAKARARAAPSASG